MNLYLAVNDYQHGAVIIRIYAASKDAILEQLGETSWSIYDLDDPNRPHWEDESNFHTTDLHNPSPLLQQLIYSEQRTKEGKSPFSFRFKTPKGYEYIKIWARSETEVLDKFPLLESMLLKPMNSEMLNAQTVSDIDVPETLLEKFAR